MCLCSKQCHKDWIWTTPPVRSVRVHQINRRPRLTGLPVLEEVEHGEPCRPRRLSDGRAAARGQVACARWTCNSTVCCVAMVSVWLAYSNSHTALVQRAVLKGRMLAGDKLQV